MSNGDKDLGPQGLKYLLSGPYKNSLLHTSRNHLAMQKLESQSQAAFSFLFFCLCKQCAWIPRPLHMLVPGDGAEVTSSVTGTHQHILRSVCRKFLTSNMEHFQNGI
jgi:hypothetical protein